MVCLVKLIASLLSLPSNRTRTHHRRFAILSAILLLAFPLFLAAQQSPQAASPIAASFTSATLKPSAPQTQGRRIRLNGDRLETTHMSLLDLISFAYGLHATQIIGAPDWVQVDKYDLSIQANAADQMNEAQWTSLLQTYLMESFQLRFHRDTRELPLYVLAAGQPAPRLATSKRDPRQLPELSITLGSHHVVNANLASISVTNGTMSDLAGVLQRVVLEWPVVDHTGITGRYDFALTWTPDGAQFGDVRTRTPAPVDVPNPPPYLAIALPQQLGLTLDLVDAPLPALVIDYVEKAAGNTERQARVQGKLSERIWHRSRRAPWLTFSTDMNPFLVTNNLY